MKAISLWQPWASLWCSERKRHETRHWPTRHRGWLLVHAAKKFIKDFEPGDPFREMLEDEYGGHWAVDLPTGALIGAVHIGACALTEIVFPKPAPDNDDYISGDFYPGRYAWRRDHYRLFAQPIPYRGAQGLFDVPDELIKQATDSPDAAARGGPAPT